MHYLLNIRGVAKLPIFCCIRNEVEVDREAHVHDDVQNAPRVSYHHHHENNCGVAGHAANIFFTKDLAGRCLIIQIMEADRKKPAS